MTVARLRARRLRVARTRGYPPLCVSRPCLRPSRARRRAPSCSLSPNEGPGLERVELLSELLFPSDVFMFMALFPSDVYMFMMALFPSDVFMFKTTTRSTRCSSSPCSCSCSPRELLHVHNPGRASEEAFWLCVGVAERCPRNDARDHATESKQGTPKVP